MHQGKTFNDDLSIDEQSPSTSLGTQSSHSANTTCSATIVTTNSDASAMQSNSLPPTPMPSRKISPRHKHREGGGGNKEATTETKSMNGKCSRRKKIAGDVSPVREEETTTDDANKDNDNDDSNLIKHRRMKKFSVSLILHISNKM